MKPTIHMFMKGSKLFSALLIVLGGMWWLAPQEVAATHIVGGELTYRCLGNNLYEIRLTLRRDCLLGAPDAQFDDPASVGFFDLTTNQPLSFIGVNGQLLINFNADDTLNQVFISDCTIAGNDICVHQTTYVDTVFLPFRASGYTMAYQRCCRNESLTNVLNPLSTGMTLVAQLSGFAQTECNNSPQFGAFPPIYICVNEPISFDHSAFDLEGDSLVYCFETPLSGGDQIVNMPQPPPPPPYDPIAWRPPYDVFNIMGGDPLMIDPETGLITGVPNTVGQFVVGICVTAYKDGILTGKTRRDFQYNVRNCRDVPTASFTSPDLECDGYTIAFTNTSIFADEYIWYFDYADPNSPTSTETNPTYTFPGDGFYQVALIAYDSNMICYDTLVREIGVFTSELMADFSYDIPACTDSIYLQVTDLSSDPEYPLAEWSWLLTYPGGVLTSTEQNPLFTFYVDDLSTIFLALVVTDINGCTDAKTVSFPVQPLSLQFNPESEHLCENDSTHLLLNGNCDLTYTWSPMDGLDLTSPCDPVASPDSTTTYYVTVTDGLCELSDSIRVEVQALPELSFTYETDCKSLDVTFTNTSTGGILYHWDFGVPMTDADTSNLESPSFVFPGPGEYTVTLSSRDGCDASVSQVVTVNVITETLDDQLVNCFEESIALNPDHNPDYTYSWTPSEFLDDSTSANPIATVEDDTWFYVTISEDSLPGCEIVDSVLVIIPDNFEIDGGGDVTRCDFDELTLTATTDGNVVIVWTDLDGNVLAEGPELTVNPINTTSYIVTGTDTLGCSKSDTVTVSRPDPTFTVDAGPDTTYCDIQTITLTATSIDGITFEWFNEAGELIGEGPQVDVTPGGPACFYVIGTDPLECQAADTVCLTPVFLSIDGGDQSVCRGEEFTVTVIHVNGENLTYEWFPETGILAGQGTPTITAVLDESLTYSVIVTTGDGGCQQTLTSTIMVYQFDPIDIIITADPDTVILTQPVQLTVNQNPNYVYNWTASTGEIVPGVYNPVVTPTGPTTYVVTVTDEFGCTGTASISIAIMDPFCDERDIFIPNAFTPHNGGVNDILYVRGNFISTMELHIYNRWGEKVFTSTDQSIGWDGTYKGEKLQPDVFGYYVNIGCPNGKSYFKKGNITLLE